MEYQVIVEPVPNSEVPAERAFVRIGQREIYVGRATYYNSARMWLVEAEKGPCPFKDRHGRPTLTQAVSSRKAATDLLTYVAHFSQFS